ncbi:MAG: M14 family zinc carboxypeptidase [Anaerolineae bacterium]|nr:M14 family zinc carboxypeptidase [Anaerolineae bacterium]
MSNSYQTHSRQQIVILISISLVVLIVAGILGGFLASALAASRPSQPEVVTSTAQPTGTPPVTVNPTATQQSESPRPTSTPISEPTPTIEPTAELQPSPTLSMGSEVSPISPTVPVQAFYQDSIMVTSTVQGRPIYAHRFGTGPSSRAIIGAIHGGYEWNTATMLTRTLTLLLDNPLWVPSGVTLYVIPNMNPDGYAAGTDAIIARMNANLVDLNRNWDYQWQMTATHGTRPVKAGTKPFSEPETRGVRDFILENDIEAVIFYHSALGVVFHGANVEKSHTYALTQSISEATGYPIQESIPGQITTGDAIDYLSEIGIAGTEVELTTHSEVSEEEFQRNINGLKAFLAWTPDEESLISDDNITIEASSWMTHVIKEGDTLSALALEYSTTIEQLMVINGLSEGDTLYIGADILVPKPQD